MLGIDDPLDAFSVHGACGFWGCIASGLTRFYVRDAGTKVLIGCCIGPFIILAWVTVCCCVMFFCISKAGLLRVSAEHEERGMDEVFHGGLGYNINGSRMPSRSQSRGETMDVR